MYYLRHRSDYINVDSIHLFNKIYIQLKVKNGGELLRVEMIYTNEVLLPQKELYNILRYATHVHSYNHNFPCCLLQLRSDLTQQSVRLLTLSSWEQNQVLGAGILSWHESSHLNLECAEPGVVLPVVSPRTSCKHCMCPGRDQPPNQQAQKQSSLIA